MIDHLSQQELQQKNEEFLDDAEQTLRELFDLAKSRNELHFAFSLAQEFRGLQDPGWNTASDSVDALAEYIEFLSEPPQTSRLKIRIALGFYCHLAEASGLYEVPKNMLRVAGGEYYNPMPFSGLVERHRLTGESIAPNANKIMKDLIGHSADLNLHKLSQVFRGLFEPDLRNGYAHADYVVWSDGIRLPRRNGGVGRLVSYDTFNFYLNRAINFFLLLQDLCGLYMRSYNPSKQIIGALPNGPTETITISYSPENGVLSITNVK